jgi:hypothetical protein
MNSIRAQFITPNSTAPLTGSYGDAWPCNGHDDPESAGQGAYGFQPDGEEEGAYYVDPQRDLIFLPFRVVDLEADEQHGEFSTLEEARGCVRFDKLKSYAI